MADNTGSTHQPPIVFRYAPALLVVMALGIPIVIVMAVLLPSVSIYLLWRPVPLSVWMQLDCIFVGLLGIGFGWIISVFLRTWYAPFTTYEVDRRGINFRFFSSESFVSWDRLQTVNYRKGLGQIDLRFNGIARTLVLSNVDIDPERRGVRAALQLIEEVAPDKISRTIL